VRKLRIQQSPSKNGFEGRSEVPQTHDCVAKQSDNKCKIGQSLFQLTIEKTQPGCVLVTQKYMRFLIGETSPNGLVYPGPAEQACPMGRRRRALEVRSPSWVPLHDKTGTVKV